MQRHEILNALTNAINDYGSEQAQSYWSGLAKSEVEEWVSQASDSDIDSTVKAIDEYVA